MRDFMLDSFQKIVAVVLCALGTLYLLSIAYRWIHRPRISEMQEDREDFLEPFEPQRDDW